MKKSVQDGLPKPYQFIRVENLIYSGKRPVFSCSHSKEGPGNGSFGIVLTLDTVRTGGRPAGERGG